MNSLKLPPRNDILRAVKQAIDEDLGSGDISAQLVSESQLANAKIISRANAILCGSSWATETCKLVDPNIAIDWKFTDGDSICENQIIAEFKGSARSILTAERTMLNFLQTLSATATITHQLVATIAHTSAKILDTRKTLPGLRLAQKYAVLAGGGKNHRIGLFDAYLIKENHIASCGGIKNAIATAKNNQPGLLVEIEVQNLAELETAIEAGSDIVMLDNFSLEMTREAVLLNNNRVKLEASGNIDGNSLLKVAENGVDYISIGALTKNCEAIDLSMLFENTKS